MSTPEKMRPIKCWYCAKLGKCQVLKPCKDFVRYVYNREKNPTPKPQKVKQYTTEKVAGLLGVSRQTLNKWLKIEPKRVLSNLYAKTGLRFKYEAEKGRAVKRFILIDD